MKKVRLFLLGLFALTLLVVYWQRQTIERLRNENTGLHNRISALEPFRSEKTRPPETEGDSAELARLRNEHSELLRLRGETAVLRAQLKSKGTKAKPGEEPAPTTTESPVKIFTAKVDAELPPRQTLVTGGWPTTDGKRTFLLIEPTFVDPAGNEITPDGVRGAAGNTQITLQTRFAEVPEESLQILGLNNVKSADHESSAQLVLTKEQSELLFKTLEKLAGVEVLSAPRITTVNGRQAQVSVMDEKTIDAQVYHLGPTVDVLPQVTPDGRSIKLSVGASITRETIRK